MIWGWTFDLEQGRVNGIGPRDRPKDGHTFTASLRRDYQKCSVTRDAKSNKSTDNFPFHALGADPSPDDWQVLADICKRKNHFPVFDMAYQVIG